MDIFMIGIIVLSYLFIKIFADWCERQIEKI